MEEAKCVSKSKFTFRSQLSFETETWHLNMTNVAVVNLDGNSCIDDMSNICDGCNSEP